MSNSAGLRSLINTGHHAVHWTRRGSGVHVGYVIRFYLIYCPYVTRYPKREDIIRVLKIVHINCFLPGCFPPNPKRSHLIFTAPYVLLHILPDLMDLPVEWHPHLDHHLLVVVLVSKHRVGIRVRSVEVRSARLMTTNVDRVGSADP